MRLVRWKAVIPLALLTGLVAGLWWLFLDRALARAIEYAGAELVGARVDVGSVQVALFRGALTIRQLAVANPHRPMTNLIEAREIVAQIRLLPLLENKVLIDTMAVRGVRFGTPRRRSGALARRSRLTGLVTQAVDQWASRIRIPSLDLEGLSTVVDLSRVSLDSLRTLSQARSLAARSDSLRRVWTGELGALDPRPALDSARLLAEQLRQADLRTLGPSGVRDLVAAGRRQAAELADLAQRTQALRRQVQNGLDSLKMGVESLAGARQADLAYARSVLKLPSFERPDLSPALFGELTVERLKPILYWLNLAQQYLPPGLDPRRTLGPRRWRAPGTTVQFPRAHQDPPFLVRYAAVEAEVGGSGPAAGRYAARITGFSTVPALAPDPARLEASRLSAGSGPRQIAVAAVLDHRGRVPYDSVRAVLDGTSLPPVSLPLARAKLDWGEVRLSLELVRRGDSLAGWLAWRSAAVRWVRADSGAPAAARRGSAAWAEQLAWRALSRLDTVELEVRLSGRAGGPALGVRSNLGRALAQALRQELGAELARQETDLQRQLDRRIQPALAEVQSRWAALRAELVPALERQAAELEQATAELRRQLEALARRLPVGLP